MPPTSSRSLSAATAAAVIVLLAVASSLLLYAWIHYGVEKAKGTARDVLGGAVKAEAVVKGPGYVIVYGRCVLAPCTVDTVYIHYADGTVGAYRLPHPLRLRPGEAAVVPVPLAAAGGGKTPTAVTLSGHSTVPTEVPVAGPSVSVAATVGLLASGGKYSDPLDANPSKIRWLYVDLLSGQYRFRYVKNTDVRDASGRAPVFTANSYLGLCEMSPEERQRLGPIVVFMNPYRGARDYTVTICTTGGKNRTILLPAVDEPGKVAFDAVVLWEDQWWPGTPLPLNNYLNHVIRVTAYMNSTVVVQVLRASGPSLHMFMYSPSGLPSFDTVPAIVENYMSPSYVATHRLRANDTVVYVKPHGARLPPLDPGDLWDPVAGAWINTWPVRIVIEGG